MTSLALIIICITAAAQVASHVTWAYAWWRKPLFTFRGKRFSDRWHILSFLCWWPGCIFVALLFLNWWQIIILALVSKGIWMAVKKKAGKDWPNIEQQLKDLF